MQKLMPERISYTEKAILTPRDLQLLKDRRNRELLILLPAYFALLAIGIYKWSQGVGGLPHGGYPGAKMEFHDEDVRMFDTVAPYLFGFLILMATIYFAKQFFQLIYPLTKDISKKRKSLIYYTPAKNPMPYFNRYYLSSPLYKKQQIEVSREDFESIPDNHKLCLEIAPASVLILRLRNGEREIKFY